jgi:hypothetical protein
MKAITYVLVGAALAACARTATVSTSTGEIAPTLPGNARTLPAGTQMQATFNQAIGTSNSKVGDSFTASVSNAVMAQNGETVVPAGAVVSGHVTGLHAASNVSDQSVIRLDFDSLAVGGRSYPFEANISNVSVKSTVDQSGAKRGAVTGAAAGAVLGAIISGGELSKIIGGGLLGAAAGTVISLGTGDVSATIPAGSGMTLTTAKSITLVSGA